MIDYLYTLDYDDGSTAPEERPPQEDPGTLNQMASPSWLNAQVYAIGEKYGIRGLKDIARKKTLHSARFLSVYESTNSNDRGLRDVVTKVACQNAGILKSQQDFQAFTADLLRKTWVQEQENLSSLFV
ncbi:hypothetical protein AJ80_09499 [Polytolypa hystricis UAMH7299]|uniref:Uncharacterized protein n=1 Tax=Polytolypa hystricis (strain UAMH7299) TaxID=1447883 RepID=A0A2B7WPW7_POLH7|nr:hypothetical protein AJ80_09499 [Polytolypa hystricis UAMH7299]